MLRDFLCAPPRRSKPRRYPGKAVAETVELARDMGSPVRKKPEEIYDNSFVNNLEKSGFLKEIWGNENYKR
jgi:hypothetical protein